MTREQKITFGEMRESGVSGVVVFCSDYRCAHSVTLPADRWPDHVRLSDIEPQFVCKACGKRGADVRPDYQGARQRPANHQGHGRLKPPRLVSARPLTEPYQLLRFCWKAKFFSPLFAE
jgi:hypothetical protein